MKSKNDSAGPPLFSEEAEQQVVGYLVGSGTDDEITREKLLDKINPEYFFVGRNAILARTIIDLTRSAGSTNVVQLKHFFDSHPELGIDAEYLINVASCNSWSLASAVVSLNSIVIPLWKKRRALDILSVCQAHLSVAESDESLSICRAELNALDDVGEKPESLKFLTVDEFIAGATAVEMVGGLFPRGGRTMLYAPSGTGKSYLSYALGFEISKTMPVRYFDNENTAFGVKSWIKDWKISAGDFGIQTQISAFPQMLKLGLKNCCIFVDSLIRFYPAVEAQDFSENNATDMRQIDKTLKQLCADGNTVIILHHAKKDGTDYRGSTELKAQMEVVYRMERPMDKLFSECCYANLKREKNRVGIATDMTMNFAWMTLEDRNQLVSVDVSRLQDVVKARQQSQNELALARTVQILRDTPNVPKSELRELIRGEFHVRAITAQRWLDEWINQGRLPGFQQKMFGETPYRAI